MGGLSEALWSSRPTQAIGLFPWTFLQEKEERCRSRAPEKKFFPPLKGLWLDAIFCCSLWNWYIGLWRENENSESNKHTYTLLSLWRASRHSKLSKATWLLHSPLYPLDWQDWGKCLKSHPQALPPWASDRNPGRNQFSCTVLRILAVNPRLCSHPNHVLPVLKVLQVCLDQNSYSRCPGRAQKLTLSREQGTSVYSGLQGTCTDGAIKESSYAAAFSMVTLSSICVLSSEVGWRLASHPLCLCFPGTYRRNKIK